MDVDLLERRFRTFGWVGDRGYISDDVRHVQFHSKSPLGFRQMEPIEAYGIGFCWLKAFPEWSWSGLASLHGPFPPMASLISDFTLYKVDFMRLRFIREGKFYHLVVPGHPRYREGLNILMASNEYYSGLHFINGANFPVVGALVDDVVAAKVRAETNMKGYTDRVLDLTNDKMNDAKLNYTKLGEILEDVASRGGLPLVAQSKFSEVTEMLVSRWADAREAAAAASLASELVYGKTPWSPRIFDDAMQENESEDDKQERLFRMSGMFLFGDYCRASWHNAKVRKWLNKWRADIGAPTKLFVRAVGWSDAEAEDAALRALKVGTPMVVGAAKTLASAGVTAFKVASMVAAGGVVAAGLIFACGVIMDFYYDNREEIRLDPDRVCVAIEKYTLITPSRASSIYTVAAALSDECYDVESSTNVVRVDPFFFSVKTDINQLKDETAAQRMFTNAFMAPLMATINSNSKEVVFLPGNIQHETAVKLQQVLPTFYFKLVNRNHSHAELWSVRRCFESLVCKELLVDGRASPVVVVGGNMRQVSKIPRVDCNYGPLLTGRDSARRNLSGSLKQRELYDQLTLVEKFGVTGVSHPGATAVACFSAQDMYKRDFVLACVHKNIARAYVMLNLPIGMMDERITQYDDHVLGVRFVRRGNDLSMTTLNFANSGYINKFAEVMSWAKPMDPVYGYSVAVDTLAVVGSSYLLCMTIGAGFQEAHDVIWKMPDAGHYVLNDLTRTDDDSVWYSVPAQKFDQVVKFVVQLNGAKNTYEATTGRILGLESSIKIGGVVLEKSWLMSHQEFVSTAVHAMACANMDKSDTLLMLGRLRDAFSERSDFGWFQSSINGYLKLFGWQRDRRLPDKAKRGVGLYRAVTHWTCVQPAGSGWAEGLEREKLGVDSFEEKVKPGRIVPDEGYVSEEPVDSDVCSDASSGAKEESGFVGLMSYFRSRKPKTDTKTHDFDGFVGIGPTKKILVLDTDLSCVTTSPMTIDGALDFSTFDGGSYADQLFRAGYSCLDDVVSGLQKSEHIPAPDSGVVHIIAAANKVDTVNQSWSASSFGVPLPTSFEESDVGMLQSRFYSDVPDVDSHVVPSILVDGIAGSAKSTAVASFVRSDRSISAVVVCPTRRLAKEWRNRRVGTVVTRHKLMRSTMRGRNLLIVDECYAYTRDELRAYLSKATELGLRVVCIGDRYQQFVDGAEVTWEDFDSLGVASLRFLVSNTMPLDALKMLKSVAVADRFVDAIQTRSQVVNSIYFVDHNNPAILAAATVKNNNLLIMRDRLETDLGWDIDEKECGVHYQDSDCVSIARSQGLRTKFAAIMCSRHTRTERWLGDQPGLFYVALSRHSRMLLVGCIPAEISCEHFQLVDHVFVEGRLTNVSSKENHFSPMKVLTVKNENEGPVRLLLKQRGMWPQLQFDCSVGPVMSNWRPWPKLDAVVDDGIERMRFDLASLDTGVVPYAESEAVKYPHYRPAMGLWSIRRPNIVDIPKIASQFYGMNFVAVNQVSRDELLDQKNVVERAARPRVLEKNASVVAVESEILFARLMTAFFVDFSVNNDKFVNLQPKMEEWAASRTPDFSRKILASDLYGTTLYTVRSMGFLKTQVKVKLKRSFALEENYGQTVLASPPDFNAKFGPWSKHLLRNIRMFARPGVLIDSGYSNKDVAHQMRVWGVLRNFSDENFQADVSRQDTSHNPVTLAVFCKLMVFFGVPQDLVELYSLHSSQFEYSSLQSGLYKGVADHNLGSGDPFTLIRNIIEVLTVMVERFDLSDLKRSSLIVKGDDFLSDVIYRKIDVISQDVRATKLTVDLNRPPYHAGRFFLEDDVVPDPVRLIVKALVKPAFDHDRVNQLAEAFYDNYVPINVRSRALLEVWLPLAYSDFEPEMLHTFLDVYQALNDRNLFYDLVKPGGEGKKLVVLQNQYRCASFAAFVFGVTDFRSFEHKTMEELVALYASNGVPVHVMKGKPNDLLREGVWLSQDHAWAVVGMAEYEANLDKIENFDDNWFANT